MRLDLWWQVNPWRSVPRMHHWSAPTRSHRPPARLLPGGAEQRRDCGAQPRYLRERADTTRADGNAPRPSKSLPSVRAHRNKASRSARREEEEKEVSCAKTQSARADASVSGGDGEPDQSCTKTRLPAQLSPWARTRLTQRWVLMTCVAGGLGGGGVKWCSDSKSETTWLDWWAVPASGSNPAAHSPPETRWSSNFLRIRLQPPACTDRARCFPSDKHRKSSGSESDWQHAY